MIQLRRFPIRVVIERHYSADERAAFQIVMDAVHPSNLGYLPPSPATLLFKARILGLL